jgi:hypothetical protein
VKRFSYVIVGNASSGRATDKVKGSVANAGASRYGTARRQPGSGRHRLGTPGTVRRYPDGPPNLSGRRWARHRRRTHRPSGQGVRYATVLVLLATIGISGWFAATGASAVAQMIQP